MKIITENALKSAEMAAIRVAAVMKDKPDAALAFDCNPAMEPFHESLAALCRKGECSLRDAKIFCVCSFAGVDEAAESARRGFAVEKLVKGCGADEAKLRFPDAGAISENGVDGYDGEIAAAGGLELIILGVGLNGRMGFNEPATPFESYTHVQKLTDVTRGEISAAFGDGFAAPEDGVTMGIKTIVSAKTVVMLAAGEDKADIIHKVVYGKTVTYVPASMLQLHLDMTLYLDDAAASKLG